MPEGNVLSQTSTAFYAGGRLNWAERGEARRGQWRLRTRRDTLPVDMARLISHEGHWRPGSVPRRNFTSTQPRPSKPTPGRAQGPHRTPSARRERIGPCALPNAMCWGRGRSNSGKGIRFCAFRAKGMPNAYLAISGTNENTIGRPGVFKLKTPTAVAACSLTYPDGRFTLHFRRSPGSSVNGISSR